MTYKTTLAAGTALALIASAGSGAAGSAAAIRIHDRPDPVLGGGLVHLAQLQVVQADPLEVEPSSGDGSFTLMGSGDELRPGQSVLSNPAGYELALTAEDVLRLIHVRSGTEVTAIDLRAMLAAEGRGGATVDRAVMTPEGGFLVLDSDGETIIRNNEKTVLRAGSVLRFTQQGDAKKGTLELYNASFDEGTILEDLIVISDRTAVDMAACGTVEGGGGGYGKLFIPTNSHGDVHIFTPDGLTYDWQEAGEFVLVRSTLDETVEIHTRQTKMADPAFSQNTAVALKVGGDVVEFYVDGPSRFYVDGQAQPEPTGRIDLPSGGYIEPVVDGSPKSRNYIVTWSNGFKARVNDYGTFLNVGAISPNANGGYEGLIGNLDGNPKNDLLAFGATRLTCPTPTPSELIEFGDSWRVLEEDSLLTSQRTERTETMVSKATGRTVGTERVVVRLLQFLSQTQTTNTTTLVSTGIDLSASSSVSVSEIAARVQQTYTVEEQAVVSVMRRVMRSEEISISSSIEIEEVREVLRARVDVAASVESLSARDRALAQRACQAGGVTDAVALAHCILDVGVSGDETFVSSAVSFQQSISEITTRIVATREESVEQVTSSLVYAEDEIETALATIDPPSEPAVTGGPGETATPMAPAAESVAAPSPFPDWLTEPGYDGEVDPDAAAVGIRFDPAQCGGAPIDLVVHGLYSYGMGGDDYDPIGEVTATQEVGGTAFGMVEMPGGFDTDELLVAIQRLESDCTQTITGEIVSIEAGMIGSRSFEITAPGPNSDIEPRLAVEDPPLGWLILGRPFPGPDGGIAPPTEPMDMAYPPEGDVTVYFPAYSRTQTAGAGCVDDYANVAAFVDPGRGEGWLHNGQLTSAGLNTMDVAGDLIRMYPRNERDPGEITLYFIFSEGTCEALSVPVTVEYAGQTYEAEFPFGSRDSISAVMDRRGLSMPSDLPAGPGQIVWGASNLPEVVISVTVADVIDAAIANGSR